MGCYAVSWPHGTPIPTSSKILHRLKAQVAQSSPEAWPWLLPLAFGTWPGEAPSPWGKAMPDALSVSGSGSAQVAHLSTCVLPVPPAQHTGVGAQGLGWAWGVRERESEPQKGPPKVVLGCPMSATFLSSPS